MPARNARKGHNWERVVIKDLKREGYAWAKSSRSSSRRLDNCKIDINDVPFRIQCKSTPKRPNYQELYRQCNDLISQQYPPEDAEKLKKLPYIVAHKLDQRKKENSTITVDYDFGMFLLGLYKKYLDGLL